MSKKSRKQRERKRVVVKQVYFPSNIYIDWKQEQEACHYYRDPGKAIVQTGEDWLSELSGNVEVRESHLEIPKISLDLVDQEHIFNWETPHKAFQDIQEVH